MEWGEPMLVHLTKKKQTSQELCMEISFAFDLDHQRQRDNQKAV